VPGRRDETANILQNLDPSIPTRTLSDDPKTQPPPPAPERGKTNLYKPKGIDPFEVAKREFEVNVLELLHWHVPTELQGEISRSDKATFYLIFDKCFRMLVKGELKHWGLAPLDGEAQAMYLWFYWESFGRGYRACPMGNAQLQQLLGWSRNKVKRVLKRLLEYGHPIMENGIVSALEQFPPFEYVRPQVYRVYLPREILATRWRELMEQARRQSGTEGIQELRSRLVRDSEAQEILPIIEGTTSEISLD
jgi:hypothetical protein